MTTILITFWLTNILIAILWALLWVSVRRDLAALKNAQAEQMAVLNSALAPKVDEEGLPFAEEIET